MKMICEVPDEVIKCIKDGTWCGSSVAEEMIANGIPLSSSEEPCEDAISRQAAIDTIESWLSCDDYNEAERHIMRAMQSVLYDLPSVNPQKPKSECEHDHEILKAYSDGASAVLYKVRAEISERSRMHMDGDLYIKTSDCMQIINEFMAEGSGEE